MVTLPGVYMVDLSNGAELRPLEPWQAEEFLAHMDRARETVDPWIPWASVSHDLESARQTLQRYAERQASDEARLYGIWLNGILVGGTMFVAFSTESGNCEIGCWLEPAATGRGPPTRRGPDRLAGAVCNSPLPAAATFPADPLQRAARPQPCAAQSLSRHCAH